MLLESARFGSVEIDETKLIKFQGGLLGFEEASNFVLMDADETGVYVWLQSVDDPDLAFLAVAPNFFFPTYEPDIDDGDAMALGLNGETTAQTLCLVTIDGDAITANLLGPVILNVDDRVARQVVLQDQGWTTAEPLGIG